MRLRYDANEGVLGPSCCLIDNICVLYTDIIQANSRYCVEVFKKKTLNHVTVHACDQPKR